MRRRLQPRRKSLAGANWEGEWADKDKRSSIKIWDLKTGDVTATITGGVGWTWSLAFSPDGKRLIGSGDKGLEVWDRSSGKAVHSFPGGHVWQFGLSPDGKRAAYCHPESKTVLVVNPESGERIGTLEGFIVAAQPKLFEDAVRATAFSPDGKLLATGNDKQLLLWDAEKLELVKKIDTPAGWLAFEPGGKTLLTAKHNQNGEDRNHVVTRWDLTSFEGKPLPPLVSRPGWTMFQLSPDGKTLFSLLAHGMKDADYELRVRAYDAATGKAIERQAHTGEVWSVAASPDATLLASAGCDGRSVWDLASGSQFHLSPGRARPTCRVQSRRQDAGRLLENGPFVLFDAASGAESGSGRRTPPPGQANGFSRTARLSPRLRGRSGASGHLVRGLRRTFWRSPARRDRTSSPDGKMIAADPMAELSPYGIWRPVGQVEPCRKMRPGHVRTSPRTADPSPSRATGGETLWGRTARSTASRRPPGRTRGRRGNSSRRVTRGNWRRGRNTGSR